MPSVDLTVLWPDVELEPSAPCGLVSALAFDPTGTRLVASVGSTVLVIDAATGEIRQSAVATSDELFAPAPTARSLPQASASPLEPDVYARRLHVGPSAHRVAVEWVCDPAPGNMVAEVGVLYAMDSGERLYRSAPYDCYVNGVDAMVMAGEVLWVAATRDDELMLDRVRMEDGASEAIEDPELEDALRSEKLEAVGANRLFVRKSRGWESMDVVTRARHLHAGPRGQHLVAVDGSTGALAWSARDTFHKNWGGYGGLIPIDKPVTVEDGEHRRQRSLTHPLPTPFAAYHPHVAWVAGHVLEIETW